MVLFDVILSLPYRAGEEDLSFDLTRYYLEQYPEMIPSPNANGDFLLHLACGAATANPRLIHLLMENDPSSISKPNHKGMFPLHHACSSGCSLEVISLLVLWYPQALQQMDDTGRLPLHAACRVSGNTQVLSFLLQEYPQAIQIRDGEGNLPLHSISPTKDSEAFLLLLHNYPEAIRCPFGPDQRTPIDVVLSTSERHPSVLTTILEWFKTMREEEDVLAGRTVLAMKRFRPSRAAVRRIGDDGDKILHYWNVLVTTLWFCFLDGGDQQRQDPPQLIQHAREWSDEEFLQRHEWMIPATCSLLLMNDNCCELLQVLCDSFNADVALNKATATGSRAETPLLIALRLFPQWEASRREMLERGIDILLNWNSMAARVPDANGVPPLLYAIHACLSFETIHKMVDECPGTVQEERDHVDGGLFHVFELAAASGCSLSVIYALSRSVLPGKLVPILKHLGQPQKRPC